LEGKDKEKLLLRALELIRQDVAKDDQEVEYLDQAHEHGTALTEFPIKVRTESQGLEELIQLPEMQEMIGRMRTNIRLHGLERESYTDE